MRLSGRSRTAWPVLSSDASQDCEAMSDASPDAEAPHKRPHRLGNQIPKLEALVEADGDTDLKDCLETKREERDLLRARIRSLKPLRTQLRAAAEARDKAVKKHADLSMEVNNIQLLLGAKKAALAEAAKDVERRAGDFERVAELQKLENLATVSTAAPSQPQAGVPTDPAGWAAAFASSMPLGMAAAFQEWIAASSQAGFPRHPVPHAGEAVHPSRP